MDAIAAIADRHGLAIVEDACQAHGATFRGRRVGSFGHGAFSLYGTKNMTTGEGGLITTDDDRLADWIRLYRNQGMRERYQHEILGYNFRLTDIAAAIGLCQLDKLERNTARRQAIAARYDAAFADLPIRTPVTPDGRTHVFHQYTIDVGHDAGRHRRATSPRPGSATGIYYPIPVHRQPYVLERGIHADLPRHRRRRGRTPVAADVPGPDRRGAGRRSIDGRAAAVDGRSGAGADGPATAAARAAPPAMTGAWSPVGAARAARRADRASARWGATTSACSRHARRPARRRSPTRIATALAAAAAGDRRPGVRASRWRCSPRPTSTRSSSPPPRPATCRSPSPRSSAASPSSSRSRSPRRRRRRTADRGRGVARPARRRSRSATSSGSTRPSSSSGACSRPAGCRRVFAISSRRAGPFPARIRDVGVTVDLATHDVDILCAIAGERPARVSAETAQRIHADHEDLLFGLMSLPVRDGRRCSMSTG